DLRITHVEHLDIATATGDLLGQLDSLLTHGAARAEHLDAPPPLGQEWLPNPSRAQCRLLRASPSRTTGRQLARRDHDGWDGAHAQVLGERGDRAILHVQDLDVIEFARELLHELGCIRAACTAGTKDFHLTATLLSHGWPFHLATLPSIPGLKI